MPRQSSVWGLNKRSEHTITTEVLLALIVRNLRLIGLVLASALLIGFLIVLLRQPSYRAAASVQIEQQVAKVLGTEDADQFQAGADAERFLQTQIDILKSRDIAERVVDRLKLSTDPAFYTATNLNLEGTEAEPRDHAVRVLQNCLSISSQRLSRVVRIQIDSRDPYLSARLANAYAQAFIDSNLDRRFKQTSYSRQFLEDKLQQARIKLQVSEQAVVDFARRSGLIELASPSQTLGGGAAEQSLITSDLGQFRANLAQTKAARIAAEQQWKQAQITPVGSLPEIQSNAIIQQLSQQLATARAEHLELQQRLMEQHPLVLQKKANAEALAEELARQTAAAKDAIHNRYLVAKRQEASLAKVVSGLRGDTIAERDQSIQYGILRREVDTNRILYDTLLQRYKEVSTQAGVTTSNISIVDPAIPQKTTTTSQPLITMGMALLLGLLGAMACVAMRERLNDTLRRPEEFETSTQLPLFGVTPQVASGNAPLDAINNPRSPYSEAIHAIRTSLELSTSLGMPISLALTSACPEEGKSTLAYAIAIAMAKIGKRVVLIDADMRAPCQHSMFGLENTLGLSQILSRQAELSEVLITPSETSLAESNLKIITSGPLPPDPTMLLGGGQLKNTIAALKEQHDLVILDCPPLLGLADAVQIGAQVDGVLMVVEADCTRLSSVKMALGRLQAHRIGILGGVLSKFDARKFGYSKDYSYAFAGYGSVVAG